MNIENLEAFVYVFHLGSFNKAAEALYLTQPSVSARIQSLERELNAKLFHRDGKQTVLSDHGKKFLPYAQSIVQSYQEARLQLQQKSLKKTELTIACSLSVSNYIMPEILAPFRTKYPDVTVRIMTGHSHDVLESVLNHEAELGIARSVSHDNIDSLLFHKDPIHLVVPPGHSSLKKRSPVSLEEVSRQPLIFFDYGSIDWLLIHGLFESKKLVPNVIMEVDSMEAAKKMVMKGIGIAFLPELCVQNELKTGQLYQLPVTPMQQIARNIDCLYLKEGQRPWFLDFFTQFINFETKRMMLLDLSL